MQWIWVINWRALTGGTRIDPNLLHALLPGVSSLRPMSLVAIPAVVTDQHSYGKLLSTGSVCPVPTDSIELML